jgi:hypothetical protein
MISDRLPPEPPKKWAMSVYLDNRHHEKGEFSLFTGFAAYYKKTKINDCVDFFQYAEF